MTAESGPEWLNDFGIEGRKPPTFFTGTDKLTRFIPQAHLIRRAFETLIWMEFSARTIRRWSISKDLRHSRRRQSMICISGFGTTAALPFSWSSRKNRYMFTRE